MKTLCLATRNPGKVTELQALLAPEWSVTDLSQLPHAPIVEEKASTIFENAVLKAVQVSAIVPGLILADDSGLEVAALDGAPGVYSARYAGVAANAIANNQKLLIELQSRGVIEPSNRKAQFRCVLALAKNGKFLESFEGICPGTIALEPFGAQGFGYDPLFIPEGHSQTFAQMPSTLKNQISHRALALEKFLRWSQQHTMA